MEIVSRNLEMWSSHLLLLNIQPLTHSLQAGMKLLILTNRFFKFWLIVFSLKNPPIFFFKSYYIFFKNPPNPYELTLPLIDQIGMFPVSTVLDGINPHRNQVFLS